MTERKMATVRRIDNILPIENADAIELAIVGGWKVVTKKDEYKIGDITVYCEIDSWIPHEIAPFLSKDQKPRIFNNVLGEKLKTVRLRGQISQGLLIPISVLDIQNCGNDYQIVSSKYMTDIGDQIRGIDVLVEGLDVSKILNIQKYDPPISAELAGLAKGTFPGFIKKTDQERCQNLSREIFTDNKDSRYEVTMKLDGTSFSGYYRDGAIGVCSRNLELQIIEGSYNSLARMFIDSGLAAALHELRLNYTVQGELMGNGIQGNREKLNPAKLFVFDIYDINTGCYLPPAKRHETMLQLFEHGTNINMVQHVPVLYADVSLEELGLTNTDELLKFAEGPSLVHPIREGLVYKRLDGEFSFKTISNHFLLKQKE